MSSAIIPEEFVGKFYTADKDNDSEKLLFDGTLLQDGMIVLIGDPNLREENVEYDEGTAYHYWKIVANRWCLISNVVVEERGIVFIATYADGMMIKRGADVGTSWIVKTDSIPPDQGPKLPLEGVVYGKVFCGGPDCYVTHEPANYRTHHSQGCKFGLEKTLQNQYLSPKSDPDPFPVPDVNDLHFGQHDGCEKCSVTLNISNEG